MVVLILYVVVGLLITAKLTGNRMGIREILFGALFAPLVVVGTGLFYFVSTVISKVENRK